MCLAFVLSATSASAQSVDEPRSELKIPTFVWTSAAAADWITTYRFSSTYGNLLHERNPLISGFDGHPAWMVTAGASIDAATWWAANRFLGRQHPRLMKLALYGAATYRVYLAAYNIQMMREARALIRDTR